MKKIILRKDIIEIIKCQKDVLKPIANFDKESLLTEIDTCLDFLKKIQDTKITDLSTTEINDYNNYLKLLDEEKYEELTKYEII